MPERILIVDDNVDNRKLLVWLLEDEGYDSVEAASAEAGLALLEAEKFDLVLLDISLPGMNGDEAAARLRENPRYADLPIVAVTAHAIRGETERIMASGVTALVTKPVDEDALVALVRELLDTTP